MIESVTQSIKKAVEKIARPSKWWVRNDPQTVYGPVEWASVQSWVAEGRIGPTGEISSDNTTWQLAASYPELGMEWLMVMPDGTFYGPVHAQALNELLKDPAWSKDCQIYRKTTNGTTEDEKLKGEIESLTRQLASAKHLTELEKSTRLQQLQALRTETTAAEEKLRADYSKLYTAYKQLAAAREADVNDLQNQYQSAIDELQAQQQADVAALNASYSQKLNAANAAHAEESAAMQTKLQQLQEECARLQRLLDDADAALQKERELSHTEEINPEPAAKTKPSTAESDPIEAEVVSIEIDGQAIETPLMEQAKNKVNGIFTKVKEGAKSKFASGKKEGAIFGNADKESMAKLEQQLQMELSRLSGMQQNQ